MDQDPSASRPRPSGLSRHRRFNVSSIQIQPPPANLSPTSLVRSLILLSHEVGSMDKPKLLQIHNVSSITRRIKLLSVLFEEIKETGSPLPPSAMLCFRELFITVQRVKLLVENCMDRSCIWSVMENESISLQFHSLTQDMAKALDILPLRGLDVADDVREQVDLVRKQASKAKPFVDPHGERLKAELSDVMRGFEQKRIPDTGRLRSVFESLGLHSPSDYEAEIWKLQEEITVQAGTGGLVVVLNINNLISLILYGKCVVFGVADQECMNDLEPCSPSFQEASNNNNMNSCSKLAETSISINVPDEFKCPISLDLMKDPVIVATGHTYDRCSIAQWIDSGHTTCPKSGQKLFHMGLIPNFALRSLIGQWCEENNIPCETDPEKPIGSAKLGKPCGHIGGIDHISSSQAALEATKMTAAFLVGKLATGSPETQRQSAFELRLLAKSGTENRRCIAEAGAIPFLVSLLSSADPISQENAVTALLNLSIYDNNRTLIMAAGALDGIIQVLQSGKTMESRENAAAALFSLSAIDDYKITIGSRPGAIPALIGLLRDGTSRGKKDAATALFNLSVYNGNKPNVVMAGAIPLLVDLLTDERAGITDDALAVLAILATSAQGLEAISCTESAITVLVDLLRLGSSKGKENSTAVLLALCRSGGHDMVKRLLKVPSTLPFLKTLASSGSPRAMRKATSLLKLLINGNVTTVTIQ